MIQMVLTVALVFILYAVYRLYLHFRPAPSIDSRGKYVLISGCDSGFGNALAIELDKQNYTVFAGIYNPDSKDQLKKQLSSRAIIFKLDITRLEDINAAYKLVKDKTDTLHALVNNAGIATAGYIDWITVDSMRQLMDINFFGHVDMTKTFLPLLIRKKDSRVVNVCSVAGFLVIPACAAYCASKYALESFSDCLRREMEPWNLRVSIIEPGAMRTQILEHHAQSARDTKEQLSIDVQERWGEEYLKKYIKTTKLSDIYKYAEDPMKVVRAIQHAVTSTTPKIRYRPGWQAKLLFFPLSIVPARLADLYFKKSSLITVIPAGVKKQLEA